ncbi:MAG: intradiol ring-cleavage dioxygenase [Deltaproteobacteria bacterium]|nr:intradiol ring-cleavage dioxygenase [Deltaproteobacteria bacterium]
MNRSRLTTVAPPAARALARREFLRKACLGLAAIPLISACDSTSASGVDGAPGGPDGATGPDAKRVDGGLSGGWATGGTASMTGKASYPDPFTGALSACALVATTTEGPCTTTSDLAREDVSESWTGLPVRLGFKVVDSSCNPVAGAIIKIWHTNLAGVYSGNTPNPGMCSNNDAAAIAANWFRGVQTTSSAGIAYFDTCFPGWYNGRAVHIHFQVKSGTTSYKVSQVFFPEDVTADIFANHSEYSGSGQPNTTFASDNVYGAIPTGTRALHILDVAQMSDGAMLASKVVTVTS